MSKCISILLHVFKDEPSVRFELWYRILIWLLNLVACGITVRIVLWCHMALHSVHLKYERGENHRGCMLT